MSLARSSQTLFSASKDYHNVNILKTKSIHSYVRDFSLYYKILQTLRWKGMFLNHSVPETGLPPLKLNHQELTPLALLALPLDTSKIDAPHAYSNPAIYSDLELKRGLYMDMICDVLDNELAKRNYEAGVPDQENVSERMHGLQSAKIAALLGFSEEDMLALLLHDIARSTVNSDLHGHKVHHLEGSAILAPLGLPLDYVRYHGFAKYLLNEFCPAYQDLLSPLSRESLKLQQQAFEPQIKELQKLDNKQLAEFLQKIMYMRLIDDVSKVPELALAKVMQPHCKPQYLTDAQIRRMLSVQFDKYIAQKKISPKELETQLDAAIKLMSRAKEFSHHQEFYPDLGSRLSCR
jgi:predicted HD phosphohydrolase